MRLTPLVFLALAAAPVTAHEDDPKILDKKPRVEAPAFRRGPALAQAIAALADGPSLKGPTTLEATVPDFQGSNVTLLSWLPIAEFGPDSSANDCWGYVSGSGREYAIIGLSQSTAFVEITDPGNAQIIAVEPGPGSMWRDTKTYQTYAYSVSEGGSGIQVFDLANIDAGAVSYLGNVTSGTPGVPQSHNVAIDEESGYLYRCGGGDHGLRFYSLANPSAPSFVGSWNTRYVHDAQVVTYTSGPYAGRQIAFACSGFNLGFSGAGLDVIDVTNKNNPIVLANESYSSSAYSHQGWLSEDRQYFYLNDEGDGQPRTIVFDVSNINNPFEVATYNHGNVAITHNLFIHEGKSYHSSYTSGLQVFDLSNPTAPTEVASFDTSPDVLLAELQRPLEQLPFFPSGTVIGSDIERGLFVWHVGDPVLSFDFPAGVPDFVDPGLPTEIFFDVSEQGGSLVPASLELYVDAGSGYSAMPFDDLGGGSYRATLGALDCGGGYRFFISASSDNGVTWTSPGGAPSAHYQVRAALTTQQFANYDMEGPQGWTAGAAGDDAVTGLWVRGNPTGTEAQPELDHTGGIGNVDCWYTGADASSLSSDDVDDGSTSLLSPIFDLSTAGGATVSYWRWYSNDKGETPNEDVFEVFVSDDGGSSWTSAETVGPGGPDSIGDWIQHEFLVADFVDQTSQVRVKFVASDLGEDSIVEAAIDDFRINVFDCDVLTTDVSTASVVTGSPQEITLDVGPTLAGQLYWMVGSLSGTSPGLPIGSFVLPLNPDFYFNLTLSNPNLPPLTSSLGSLNILGQGTATFALNPGSPLTLIGTTLHHAAAVIDPAMDELIFVSNAVPVTLVM